MKGLFSLAASALRTRMPVPAAAGSLLGIAALSGALLAPAPAARADLANPCDPTPKTLPFSLDFKSALGCVLDVNGRASGFTAYQANDASRGIAAYQPNLIELDTTAGTLTLTSTATVSGTTVFGSNFRNDNTQVNALQVPFDASAIGQNITKVFTITAQIKGDPVKGLSQIDVARDQAAVFFGPDQDNYVKLAIIGGKPGGTSLEFIDEQGGKIGELQGAKTSLVSVNAISSTIQTLDLMLVGDQESGKVAAFYAINGGAPVKMPFDVTLSGSNNPSKKDQFFNDGTGSNKNFPASSAGILVTNKNRIGPVTVAFSGFSIINANRPSADAGIDQAVTTGNTVLLGGKGNVPADKPTRTIASYGWSLSGAQPANFGSGVVLSGTDALRSFTAPAGGNGTLTFTLVVTDNTGAVSTPDTMQVVVNESPLKGLTATSNSPTTLGQPTLFNASVITGTNVSYSWDFGDGDSDNGASVSHIYDFVGTYTATVTASNSIGTLTQTLRVTVKNDPPVANAGATQNVAAGVVVTLDGSASTDPDGHLPLTYGWRQERGGFPVTLSDRTAAKPTFTAPVTPTALLFTLIVTDSRGLVSQRSGVTINVGDPTVAELRITSSSPTVLGGTTAFTATAASGAILTYSWEFGDGTVGTGQNVTHVYTAEGEYIAVVTATNNISTSTASAFVSVTNTAPLANAGADRTVVGDTVVTLSGTGSDPDNHLPLTYSWSQLNGAPVELIGSDATRTFTAPKGATVLVFELTVTDKFGKSSTDTVQITVTRAPTKQYLPIVLK